jgi:hypothetical protein
VIGREVDDDSCCSFLPAFSPLLRGSRLPRLNAGEMEGELLFGRDEVRVVVVAGLDRDLVDLAAADPIVVVVGYDSGAGVFADVPRACP